jgi:glycosyltransferase involved in cell wall biosynthesis
MKIVGMILTYNCEDLLEAAFEKIPKEQFDELYVMDDGSTDRTVTVANRLGLEVRTQFPNQGYGANVKAGLIRGREKGADYVVEIHGDGAQFNPKAVIEAVPHMKDGADFIVGSRFAIRGRALKSGMPWARFLANRFLGLFDRLILGLPISEFHTGFLIYGKNFLKKIPFESNSNTHLCSFQVLAQAAYFNLKVREVPVDADYHAPHTSYSYWGATFYALGTFLVLTQFLCAKTGLFIAKIFTPKQT